MVQPWTIGLPTDGPCFCDTNMPVAFSLVAAKAQVLPRLATGSPGIRKAEAAAPQSLH